jgi:hypothetical protein
LRRWEKRAKPAETVIDAEADAIAP